MKNKMFTGLTALLLASPLIAQAQVTTIAAWTFDAGGTKAANYDSPPATTGSGTVTVLGMNNNYNGTFATNFCDVLSSPGSSAGTNGWRIRGNPGNGWSSQSDQRAVTRVVPPGAIDLDELAVGIDDAHRKRETVKCSSQ